MMTPSRFPVLTAAVVLGVVLAVPGAADERSEPATAAAPESPEASPTPPPTIDPLPAAENKLSIHGYLSQGYAHTLSGPSMLGIPEGGTTDYRTAALQVRYAMTGKDAFVLQFSHERSGAGPGSDDKDLEIDWAFYSRRLNDNFSVKAGRIQMPIGVFNEVRDVGTLLPFFRPPESVYGETVHASETLNGVGVTSRFGQGGGWGLEADAFFGEWSTLQEDGRTRSRATNGFGGRLWVLTPVSGVRVGGGGWRADFQNLLSAPGRELRLTNWSAAADVDLQRARVVGEYFRVSFDGGRFRGYYVQGTVRATDRLSLNGQLYSSQLNLNLVTPRGPFSLEAQLGDGVAAGVGFAFRPDLVAKLEHHWVSGVGGDGVNRLGPNVDTRYLIVSLSASF